MVTNDSKIQFLIDSESIDYAIPLLSRRALSLFKYRNVTPLFFMRTPAQIKNEMLNEIPPIELVNENNCTCVKIKIEKLEANYAVNPFVSIYSKGIAENLYNKKDLTKEEIKPIKLAFVQDAINRCGGQKFLITENRFLLNNSRSLQRSFSTPLNILSMDEAAEMVDLFWKKIRFFTYLQIIQQQNMIGTGGLSHIKFQIINKTLPDLQTEMLLATSLGALSLMLFVKGFVFY